MTDQVRHRLEELLAAEAPPDGVDPALMEDGADSREYDAYAAWSMITSLVQEVKLQGRAFKELSAEVGGQPARVADEIRAAYREREREIQREAERRSRREILDHLLDLRETLERGVQSAEAATQPAPRTWLEKLVGPDSDPALETAQALLKGARLALDRLDRTLEQWNVTPIRMEGEVFDPRRMNAVDIEETASAADGTVTAVYRAGYEWNGEVVRTAQVRVARRPATTRNAEG